MKTTLFIKKGLPGNILRVMLLQTMQRYPEAEKMHLKAIQIKESLLGTEDYEVRKQ